MLSAKYLLLTHAREAFRGRADMPLMASLQGITPQEATWSVDSSRPSVEHIVRHIAWSKSRFCAQGFGRPMVFSDASVNDAGDSPDLPLDFPCGAAWGLRLAPGIAEAIKLLEASQRVFIDCLESCDETSLEESIPAPHGKSAANFFWTMLMHDIYHAGQIRTRRTLYGAIAAQSGGT